MKFYVEFLIDEMLNFSTATRHEVVPRGILVGPRFATVVTLNQGVL